MRWLILIVIIVGSLSVINKYGDRHSKENQYKDVDIVYERCNDNFNKQAGSVEPKLIDICVRNHLSRHEEGKPSLVTMTVTEYREHVKTRKLSSYDIAQIINDARLLAEPCVDGAVTAMDWVPVVLIGESTNKAQAELLADLVFSKELSPRGANLLHKVAFRGFFTEEGVRDAGIEYYKKMYESCRDFSSFVVNKNFYSSEEWLDIERGYIAELEAGYEKRP